MIRAIIFDFDGLILDTESPDFLAWRKIRQAHGCDLSFSTGAQGVGVSLEMFDLRDYLHSWTQCRTRTRPNRPPGAAVTLPAPPLCIGSVHTAVCQGPILTENPRPLVRRELTVYALVLYITHLASSFLNLSPTPDGPVHIPQDSDGDRPC